MSTETTQAFDDFLFHLPKITQNFIKQLHDEEGVAIVLISHDLNSVNQYAKKLLYLDQKVVYFGTVQNVCMSEALMHQIGPQATAALCQVENHEHHIHL